LNQLAQSFQRFAQDIGETPMALGYEMDRVTADVDKQHRQTQRSLAQAEQALSTAKQKLQACESRMVRDRDGRRQKPDCRREKSAVDAASKNVRHARQNLDQIQRAGNRLREAQTLMQTSSARINNLANQEAQIAVNQLHKLSEHLNRYQNSQSGSMGTSSLGGRTAGETAESFKEAAAHGDMSDEELRILAESFKEAVAHGDMSDEELRILTDKSTQVSPKGGDRVVLGPDGKNGYRAEAETNGGVYFDTGQEIWNKLGSDDLSGNISTWLLNEQFLIDQLETGKPIYIHGGPAWGIDNFGTTMEINFLNRVAKDYGYKFNLDNNAWIKNIL
jgi:hypothetical protein